MSSKWCPKCGAIITTNGVPNFCGYGCGSLAEQPILPEFKSMEQRLRVIDEAKKEYEERQKQQTPSVEISPGRLQMRLF